MKSYCVLANTGLNLQRPTLQLHAPPGARLVGGMLVRSGHPDTHGSASVSSCAAASRFVAAQVEIESKNWNWSIIWQLQALKP